MKNPLISLSRLLFTSSTTVTYPCLVNTVSSNLLVYEKLVFTFFFTKTKQRKNTEFYVFWPLENIMSDPIGRLIDKLGGDSGQLSVPQKQALFGMGFGKSRKNSWLNNRIYSNHFNYETALLNLYYRFPNKICKISYWKVDQ